MIFDTGSNSLVVTSTACIQVSCLMHSRFSSDKSRTYVDGGRPMAMRFAGGDVDGELGYDALEVAGWRAPRQAMLAMSSNSIQGYSLGSFDGILGIGLGRKDGEGEASPLDSLGVTRFSVRPPAAARGRCSSSAASAAGCATPSRRTRCPSSRTRTGSRSPTWASAARRSARPDRQRQRRAVPRDPRHRPR